MIECHLRVQLNHSFPNMCLFVLAFFLWEELLKFVQALQIYPVYTLVVHQYLNEVLFPYKVDNS